MFIFITIKLYINICNNINITAYEKKILQNISTICFQPWWTWSIKYHILLQLSNYLKKKVLSKVSSIFFFITYLGYFFFCIKIFFFYIKKVWKNNKMKKSLEKNPPQKNKPEIRSLENDCSYLPFLNRIWNFTSFFKFRVKNQWN